MSKINNNNTINNKPFSLKREIKIALQNDDLTYEEVDGIRDAFGDLNNKQEIRDLLVRKEYGALKERFLQADPAEETSVPAVWEKYNSAREYLLAEYNWSGLVRLAREHYQSTVSNSFTTDEPAWVENEAKVLCPIAYETWKESVTECDRLSYSITKEQQVINETRENMFGAELSILEEIINDEGFTCSESPLRNEVSDIDEKISLYKRLANENKATLHNQKVIEDTTNEAEKKFFAAINIKEA